MSLIQALLNPAAYPHPVGEIKLIETHISWVLLTGQYAYKIKKNIQFDFLDFSTLEKRHFYCNEELRLNRRFAPDIYLQVVPITGTPEHPQIIGSGEAIEYAVQMKQFAGNQLLSDIAERGCLDATIIDQLADLTADFHHHAKADISNSRYGTAAEIHHWFSGNFAHIRPLLKDKKFLQQIERLQHWGEQTLLKNTQLMEQRKKLGFIRECHGDLHLGNIALINNQATPFDGIEFNPGLHWIDVISEIAFIVMDLHYRGMAPLAYHFLNRYLSQSGDYEGLTLLPYYLVYRALVRAKVALLRWHQHKNPQDLREAENYANLAENFSIPKLPSLVITHGFSGSGKSTFSVGITETFGMIHLRSDVERKRLLSTSKQGGNNKVNQGIYSLENIQLIYQRLAELTASIISAGFSVLIDAAFLKLEQRDLFRQLALDKQVDFLIVDFYAPNKELKQRIIERQKLASDPSEATLAVLEHQLKTAQPFSISEQRQVILVDTAVENAFEKLMTASPFKDWKITNHQN